jgi:hypothetical protein
MRLWEASTVNSNFAINYPDYSNDSQELRVMDKPEWIRASEAAEIMKVSVSNVYYLCREKKINCRKWGNTWQVDKQDAENYERSNRNPDWLHPDS